MTEGLRIPERVRIGPQTYTVHVVPVPNQPAALGWCNPATCEMWVAPAPTKRMEQIFVHEILHAIAAEVGLEIDDETITPLEHGLYEFICDNPEVFRAE